MIAIASHGGRSIVAILVPRAARDVMLAVIVNSSWLDEVIEDIVPVENGTVAVVEAGQVPIVSHGREEGGTGWLPARNLVAEAARGRTGASARAVGIVTSRASVVRSESRDGRDFVYVIEPVENGVLNVIAGFPAGRFGAAERQLAIGLAFPFVLFLIVLGVAWFAIDRLFLSLGAAPRRHGAAVSPSAISRCAPDSRRRALELRQYATAFDQMTEVLSSRRARLPA